MPNLTGDDLAIEDEKFRAYLVSHGWHGLMGEEDLQAEADQGIPASLADRASLGDAHHRRSGSGGKDL